MRESQSLVQLATSHFIASDGYGTLLYGTVLREGATLRMWYLATPRSDSSRPGDAQKLKFFRQVAYAESSDGIHWEGPDLGLVEFRVTSTTISY